MDGQMTTQKRNMKNSSGKSSTGSDIKQFSLFPREVEHTVESKKEIKETEQNNNLAFHFTKGMKFTIRF